METVEKIKQKVEALFREDREIHIDITMSRPRLVVRGTPARIKAVYPNLFRVEEKDIGMARCHLIRYSDVLIGQVKIAELSED